MTTSLNVSSTFDAGCIVTDPVKYALLVFSLPFPFPGNVGPFNFDACTKLRKGSVKDDVEGPDSRHWSEWLGSLTWNLLCQRKLILSTWMESKTPEVLDDENRLLQDKVSTIFRILPLVGPLYPPVEDIHLFSGRGRITKGELVIENIRSFSKLMTWTRSYYNEHYWDLFHEWALAEVTKASFLDDWKNCYFHYDRLFIQAQSNRQLFESYRSFEEAMRGTQLEFKMPNLVRAMECVIDCWGHQQFAKRVLYLTGAPDPSLPYSIGTSTEALLQDLYQLRNDCSHGKPFAYSLEKKLGKVPDGSLVAKYEFLAEWAARKVLKDSFLNQSILQHNHDRDTLVNAWKKGMIHP